jgi:hypothetical protein
MAVNELQGKDEMMAFWGGGSRLERLLEGVEGLASD